MSPQISQQDLIIIAKFVHFMNEPETAKKLKIDETIIGSVSTLKQYLVDSANSVNIIAQNLNKIEQFSAALNQMTTKDYDRRYLYCEHLDFLPELTNNFYADYIRRERILFIKTYGNDAIIKKITKTLNSFFKI